MHTVVCLLLFAGLTAAVPTPKSSSSKSGGKKSPVTIPPPSAANASAAQLAEPPLTGDLSNISSAGSDKCWPKENFVMIKPGNGCPVKSWKYGRVTFYMYRNSSIPDNNLLDASTEGAYLNLHYCAHAENNTQEGCEKDAPKHFPQGSYCLHMGHAKPGVKITQNCPAGFKWSWLAIDDVNNFNQASHYGETPDGEFFSFSTVQYYCCRDDGDPEEEIVLPKEKDFVLFPTMTRKTCQKVKDMQVTKDEIFFSTEDADAGSNGAPEAPMFPPPEYGMDAIKDFWGRGFHLAVCHYSAKSSANKKKVVAAKKPSAPPKCWPKTNFGFVATKDGCPGGKGWSTGQVQHWEKPGGKSKAPEYINAEVDDQKFTIHYCMHDLEAVKNDSSCTNKNTAKWEQGSYCIFHYKIGPTETFDKACPRGFNYHWFVIDDVDENNQNSFNGSVPAGEYYDYGTVYYACCRDDGKVDQPIHLPTDKPFVLMPTATDRKCQTVEGMKAEYGELFYDSELIDSDVVPQMKPPFVPIDYTLDEPHGKWGAGMHQHVCYYTKK